MGKGDKKTRRGKLFSGSYGVLRPRNKKRGFSVVSTTKKTATKKVSPPAEAAKPEPKEVKAKDVKPVEEPMTEVKPEVKAEVKEAPESKPAVKKPSAKKAAAKKPVKPKTEE